MLNFLNKEIESFQKVEHDNINFIFVNYDNNLSLTKYKMLIIFK